MEEAVLLFHDMVAVDHHIVGYTQSTIFLHIGKAVVAVLLIKAALQIKVGFVDGLHDRIIDVCTVNASSLKS